MTKSTKGDKKESNNLAWEGEKKPGDGDERPQPVRYLLSSQDLGVGGKLVVAALKLVSFIYNGITWIPFLLLTGPFQRLRDHQRKKAKIIHSGEGTKQWHHERGDGLEIMKDMEKNKVDTLNKVFALAVKKHGGRKCLGTRELIDENEEPQPNGKIFKKLVLGEYFWKTYDEVDHIATDFCRGLTTLGVKPMERICIFAETRPEWLIAAIAAFKNNYTVVTLYATLGEDAVVHGLNETECSVVLTSDELLPKFKNILTLCPSVQHVIFMEHPFQKPDTLTGYGDNVHIHAFVDIAARGKNLQKETDLRPPGPEDVAIIMYTSGSTGVPKGVELTHKNIVAGMKGLTDGLGPTFEKDVYIAYLPLAHVLELMCEAICFLQGVAMGYSSPHTIATKSVKIKSGTVGDAVVLRPTIMVSVPFALDRIYKGIQEELNAKSWWSKALFYFSYDHKLWWYYSGYPTPIIDKIVFKKTKDIVGGRVRILISGGAPLAEDTHEFVRNCLCLPVVQGYGLTETCAATTCSTHDDMSVGRIGPPLRCCDIRLVDWKEGGYSVTDSPPRGELVIGGDNVAKGYFKLQDATDKDFFTDKNNVRWFRTGDIAQADSDGVFSIIDRKKDLVKLQMGEYVSLGKIEATLKTSGWVDTLCVVADPMKSNCIALVLPFEKKLRDVGAQLGKLPGQSIEDLCNDPDVVGIYLMEIQRYGQQAKLQRFEIPAAISLVSDLWTPDSGMVTAAFKLRRKNIKEKYQADIDRMYALLS